MESQVEPVKYEKQDNVAFITTNRPDKMNSLSADAVAKPRNAWIDFESDPDMRVSSARAIAVLFPLIRTASFRRNLDFKKAKILSKTLMISRGDYRLFNYLGQQCIDV